MKLALITIVSASLGFQATVHSQGLPTNLFDSLPSYSGPVPTFVRGPARFEVLDAALVRLVLTDRRLCGCAQRVGD